MTLLSESKGFFFLDDVDDVSEDGKEVIPNAVYQLVVYKRRLWSIFQFEFDASGFLNDNYFEIFEALQDSETAVGFFSSVEDIQAHR